jgi:hypothetical protein
MTDAQRKAFCAVMRFGSFTVSAERIGFCADFNAELLADQRVSSGAISDCNATTREGLLCLKWRLSLRLRQAFLGAVQAPPNNLAKHGARPDNPKWQQGKRK